MNWGDGSSNTMAFAHTPTTSPTFTVSTSHLYQDDNPTGTAADLNAIVVNLVDDDTGSFGPSTVANVLVNNVPPTVTAVNLNPNPLNENSTTTLTVSFTDPGVLDTWTATVDWADGSAVQTVTVGVNGTTSHSFTMSHQYLDDNPTGTPSDVYTVSVSVVDDDTGDGQQWPLDRQ